jgi:hypothetical protein
MLTFVGDYAWSVVALQPCRLHGGLLAVLRIMV